MPDNFYVFPGSELKNVEQNASTSSSFDCVLARIVAYNFHVFPRQYEFSANGNLISLELKMLVL